MKTINYIQQIICKRIIFLFIIELMTVSLFAQTVSISGTISEPGGTAVGGATVTLSGDITRSTTTDANGQYLFEQVPLDVSVSITPLLDQDCSCRTSQEEVDAINNHILNITPFESIYQYIAADINKDNIINAFDGVQLRQLVDGIIPSFANNTCWRFIDASYMFVNPTDPLSENFPEQVNIELLFNNTIADFVGVKIGNIVGGDSNCANGTMSGCEGGIDLICPPDTLLFSCAWDSLIPEIICFGPEDAINIQEQIFAISGDFCDGTFDREFTLTSISANDPTPTIKTCVQRVQILDMVAPTIECVDSVTVEADSECMGIAEIPVPMVIDDCDPNLTFENDFNNTQNASGTYPLGETVVTWIAIDGCGNMARCTTIVTVIDTIPPQVFCIDNIGTTLSEGEIFEIFPNDFIADVTDNCGIASTAISINQFDCSRVGTNLVKIFVTDESNNSVVCESSVIIQTDFSIVDCKDEITVELDPFGQASITTDLVLEDLVTSCGFDMPTLSDSDFDCSNVGVNIVTCLLYTSPSPRDATLSRMPSSA